jgi:multidrug efflux pump subunit AcrB
LVSIYLPQGSSISATNQVTQKIEKLLAVMPEVDTLSAYVGAGAPRFFISSNPEQPDPAFAKLIAVTHSKKDRDIVIDKLRQQIDQGAFPEARVRVTSLLYGPPVIWPVSFRVVGSDINELRRIAHQVREIMRAHPNVRDANLEWDERSPTLHLEMDPDRLRLIGLTPRDIAQQLQFQLDGVPITELRQDIRTVELRARGARGEALLPEQIEIKTQDGRKVPLSQLGKIEVRYEDPVIRRYNRQPSISVRGDVEGAQAPDVSWQVWKSLEKLRQQLPQDYQLEIGGSVEQSGKADASIQKLQPLMVGLMLIFIMLQMRSFSGTFMVVATAPLGLIGAVLSLLLFNQPFGFVALLGLIGLAGILMRNTLILTQQVNDNIDEGMEIRTAVVEAAVQRARPVILTAMAAALAFIPLTWDSFWGPLAYVLIGGVAVGTVITILFVPALYALWFRLGKQPKGQPA